jgi:hypothetical protein
MTSFARRSLVGFVLFAAIPATAGTIDVRNPPHGLFSDEWAEIHMAGGKVGYAHTQMRRDGDRILSSVEMSFRMGRVDQPVRMRVIQGGTETVAGESLGFHTEMDLAAMTIRSTGTIRDGKVVVRQEQMGMVTEKEAPYPPGAIMLWGAFREQMLRGFETGTRYSLTMFDSTMLVPIEARVFVSGPEDLEWGGRTIRGVRVDQEMVFPTGRITGRTWHDDEGNALVAEIMMPGLGNMRMVTVDQATALADFVPPEVFMKTVLHVPPIDTGKASRIVFRVRQRGDGDEPLDIPETGMQSVRRIDKRTVDVTVQRQRHERAADGANGAADTGSPAEPGSAPSAETAPDPARPSGDGAGRGATQPAGPSSEFLAGNLMMNLEDPELIRLGKEAANDATDPFVLGDNLRRFVRRHIREKSLGVAFATASEVARRGEGDCSEHGVFLAALGRVNRLPSRVVVGVAYAPVFGGENNILGYHMWTQFLIDGTWYDFDAALGDERIPNPARIAFAVTSLQDSGLADLSLPLLSKIGMIDVEVVSVDQQGAEER